VSDRLHSYPKVYNLGHRAIRDLFEGPVVVQEKVDGSQFSFGLVGGVLHARSRGATIDVDAPDKLFAGAVATARRAAEAGHLNDGYTYRGEAMMGPRHNTLVYDRAPHGNLVLFDCDRGLEDRVEAREFLEAAADVFECDVVPEVFRGEIADLDAVTALVERPSFLGGKMEGLVFKNYERFGVDGKMLMGKHVTDDFREAHKGNPDWKPTKKDDILEQIAARYAHPRRWEKAVERARDAGALQEAPQDIGPLLQSIQRDILEECADEIGALFFDYYRKSVLSGSTRGFPQWYKERLATQQFAHEGQP
jgi:hypothetical protein